MSSEQNLLSRAIWHEAGHLVVGLHHGLKLGDLKSESGFPTIYPFDISQDQEAVGNFLLGGLASEVICFGSFDPIGAKEDLSFYNSLFRQRHENTSIASLSHFLNASWILKNHHQKLEQFQKEIHLAALESQFEFDESFVLLDRQSIQNIWAR